MASNPAGPVAAHPFLYGSIGLAGALVTAWMIYGEFTGPYPSWFRLAVLGTTTILYLVYASVLFAKGVRTVRDRRH
jgi:hypothetical protein